MNHRLATLLLLMSMFAACTKKPDDSAAMSRAKDNANTAVEATKGAITHAADAAKRQARDLEAQAKSSELSDKANTIAEQAKVDARQAVGKAADKTQALAAKVKEQVGN